MGGYGTGVKYLHRPFCWSLPLLSLPAVSSNHPIPHTYKPSQNALCVIRPMVPSTVLKPHTHKDDLYLADSPFDKSAIGMSDYNVLV